MVKGSFRRAAGLLLGLAAVFAADRLYAQDGGALPLPPPPDPPGWRSQQTPAMERVAPGVFRLGDITISKATRSVSFPAALNMDKGLLEYLLVRVGGKTHESLLRTTVEPYQLQIALLLLGLEGSDSPLAFQGDSRKPRGDKIELAVNLPGEGGKSLTIDPAEWLAVRREIDGPLEKAGNLEWIFTGSMVMGGQFMGQTEGSIVAIYHDPAALIDNASAGGESDKIWFVREGSVPPVGTPVTVTIKPPR